MMTSKRGDEAVRTNLSTVQDRGIDYGRADLLVAQKLLDHSGVTARFEKVRRRE
jgi:hypothetical protein